MQVKNLEGQILWKGMWYEKLLWQGFRWSLSWPGQEKRLDDLSRSLLALWEKNEIPHVKYRMLLLYMIMNKIFTSTE